MTISGFTLLHSGGYRAGGRFGDVTQISLGHATDYALVVTIASGVRELGIRFAYPLAFRVQHERDLLDYWFARDGEGVPAGVLYSVAKSLYGDEFRATISGQIEEFTHFLIAADDLCVEVLSNAPPWLSDS